jgi:hypothetical protein
MSAQHPHAHGELANENVHHEESDINVRAIITFVVVLTVTALVINLAMIGLFKLFDKIEDKNQAAISPLAAPPAKVSDFPEPRLQTTPWTDLRKLRAEERAFLDSYGWVDESGGIARVPIAKAKEMLLQKGLPVRAGAPADPTEGTHYAATGESSGGRNLKAGMADQSGTPAAPSQGASPIAMPGGATGPAGPNTPPQGGQPTSSPAAKQPGGSGATQSKKPGGGK